MSKLADRNEFYNDNNNTYFLDNVFTVFTYLQTNHSDTEKVKMHNNVRKHFS